MAEPPESITLYEHRDDSIHIKVDAHITKNGLLLSGYDIGKRVKELTGSSDYEYNVTVKWPELPAVCSLLNIETGDYYALLLKLKQDYGHGTGFSAFMTLLKEQEIKYETFFWR